MTARARRMLVLVLVLAAAAAVRCWGLGFGLPHTLARPDEERVLGSALNVARGQFNPGFFSYPSFYIYLAGAIEWLYYIAGRLTGRFDSIAAFVASWPIDYAPLWLAGRLLSVVFGVTGVWLVYRLGAAAFSRRSGLIGALFLAFAFLHVRDSHFAVTDVAMATLVLFGCVALLRANRLGTTRAFAVAGIAAGLAASTKYNAALLVVPAALAALSAGGHDSIAARLRAFAVFALCFAVGFLAGTPYALLDYQQFATDVMFEGAHFQGGHALALGRGWGYHLTVSLTCGVGTPLLVSGLLGILVALRRNLGGAAVVFSFPVAYYALAGGGLTVFTRYMTPVVPFICLAAAVLVDSAATMTATWLSSSHVGWRMANAGLALAASALLVAPTASDVVAFDRLLAKTDTRVLAARWLTAAMPPGSSIFQTGVHYGHAQLEVGGQPARYAHWDWDAGRGAFTERGRTVAGLPDWIVVQRSPLVAYSTVPGPIEELVASRYRPLASFTGTRDSTGLVYDQQDAFYLPLRGFDAVLRPGPNLFVYRRVDR